MKCLVPYRHKDGYLFPCGRCPPCTSARSATWAFRLQQEDKIAISSHFITLTYDNIHVPRTSSGFNTLSKRDVQLFLKRLRKRCSKRGLSLRYYLCGEYGSKNFRPHYHAIIFNATEMEIESSWCDRDGFVIGSVFFGKTQSASIGYCLKYMRKSGRCPFFKGDDRISEFQLFSQSLGSNYITEATIQYHLSEVIGRCFVRLPGGVCVKMPKSFKSKIFSYEKRLEIMRYYFELQRHEEEKLRDRLNSSDVNVVATAEAEVSASIRAVESSLRRAEYRDSLGGKL